jgi:hypothetical protein
VALVAIGTIGRPPTVWKPVPGVADSPSPATVIE